MKTFTQTFTRNTTQELRTNLWLLSNRAGNFLGRIFIFGIVAPVGAYSIKGGSFRTRGIHYFSFNPIVQPNSQFIFSNKEFSK
jgi:hypothetical protein